MTAINDTVTEPATGNELRSFLLAADPSLLVNCLVQLTGDTSLLERYAPHFPPVKFRSFLESHPVDSGVVHEIVDLMVTQMQAREGEPLPLPTMLDHELFRHMAEFCVGEPVNPEFVPI